MAFRWWITRVLGARLPPEQREDILDKAWNSQSAFQLLVAFNDVMTDRAANDIVSEFARGKIRQIVKDPKVAELLCPKTYPIGGKRLCIGNGYFEMFNRDNVTLVDVQSDPIVACYRQGIAHRRGRNTNSMRLSPPPGSAVTGSMSRIDITGLNGRKMADKWADGPTTYLGAMVAGFPSLFMIHGR